MKLKTLPGLLTGIAVIFFVAPANAQVTNPSIVPVSVAPSGACSAALPIRLKTPDGTLWTCQSGTWAQVGEESSGTINYNQGSTGAVNRTVTSKLQESFSVLDFGAKCDGATDDTAAFALAMTAANRSAVNCGLGSTAPTASCTSAVLVPNAACVVSQIVMLNNVVLMGTGWQTSVLIQKAGSNEDFITGAAPATNQRFEVADLFINGNASNQTGTGDCIHFDSTGSLSDSTRSPRHTIENVFAANCKQDAIALTGDAGSSYVINSKGINSGRYGANINTFDTHIDIGEFASNGTAGVFLGANGNGSVASVKSWGNGGTGTAVGNAGFVVNSGNYRFANDEAQDNSCNGWYLNGVTDTSFDAALADGNGPTGGGSSCAGWVFSGSSHNTIHGNFRGVTDAGWSDYAINWIGSSNANNDITLIIDNPHVGPYLGTLGNNALHSDTQDISSASHTLNNGAVQRGYSDNQTTQTYSLDASTGFANYKENQTSAAGNSIYSCGGPNNFDFTNVSYIVLTFGSAVYSYTEGSAGTCANTNPIPLLYNPPVRFAGGTSDSIGSGIASAATIAPAVAGTYHITGTTPISTITAPVNCTTVGYGCRLTLIFDGPATLATGGNIIRAITPAAGQMVGLVYDPGTSLWYSQ